jgi:hypothetical protein
LRIDEGKVISPILPKLAAKISTIPAIQKFHFFRSKLPGDASAVFEILKNAEVANDTLHTEPIDKRWSTSIMVSALAAWRQELELLISPASSNSQ